MEESIEMKIKEIRGNCKYSPEENSKRAWAFYEEMKKELEARHKGEFILIDVDTGDYFIRDNDLELAFLCKEKYPDRQFHLIRIGYESAYQLKSIKNDYR